MITYAQLLQILVDAEKRVDSSPDESTKLRSQETIDLCNERLAIEGFSRAELEELAKGSA